jgi:hypothetical protein
MGFLKWLPVTLVTRDDEERFMSLHLDKRKDGRLRCAPPSTTQPATFPIRTTKLTSLQGERRNPLAEFCAVHATKRAGVEATTVHDLKPLWRQAVSTVGKSPTFQRPSVSIITYLLMMEVKAVFLTLAFIRY